VRRDLLLLGVLAAVAFLPALGRRDVWNPDEARYAVVAREMREAGSWALPRLNGEVYSQKPPLFFWAINGAALLTGEVDETASRLPSAVAAVAATLIVFALGYRLLGRRAAWLAAIAFATCFKVLWQGRFGQIDMVLTALVALEVWWFVRGYLERRPGFYWLFFLTGGVATLAKGPAGFLPPLLAVVAFLLVSREPDELRRLRIGRGLLVWAAVVIAWLLPAALAGGVEYIEQIVLRQNLTRYANPWHHHRPWYYYLAVVPTEFFPWSILLPAAVALGRRTEGPARQGVRLAACWAVVTLVFFSISPAKRSVYVLTMYPALALLVGAALDHAAALWPRGRRWVTAPLAALTVAVAVAVVALAGWGPARPEAAALGGPPFVWLVVAAWLPLLLGTFLAWSAARRGRVTRAAAALGGGMVAMMLLLAFAVIPRFDTFKSARAMSATLLAHLQPGDEYGIYRRLDATVLFYTRRNAVPIRNATEMRAFIARPQRVWLLARSDDWAQLASPPPLVEVAREEDPYYGYLLLTRPDVLDQRIDRATPAAGGARSGR
jgi:4-amino-4-deoxy-L-arabinose transferase-like glycosyltransferase